MQQILHKQAQEIATELHQRLGLPKDRAINDAFDAVEEATGADLCIHRQDELNHLKKYEAEH